MTRYELVDQNDNIANVIEWDGETPFDPAPYTLRLAPAPEPSEEGESPTPGVPQSVSPWQAREALRLAGLLPAVNAHIEGLGENHQVYIAWHYAERIARASPLIAALAPAFNLDDGDLDALFTTAAALSLENS